jgi:murein L,D-transpeptidase YafK
MRTISPAVVVTALLICSLLASCAPPPPPLKMPAPPPLAAPPFLPAPKARTDSDQMLLWAEHELAVIVVDKQCQTLSLYRFGQLTHTYHAVIGRESGRKLYQGDKRTPSGLYMIIGKRPHDRWARFMLLDYPTQQDVRRYQENILGGGVPKLGASYPGVGGAIGIHGSDREIVTRLGINWTLGCIALFNEDVEELYTLVPVGTLVYIKD